MKELRYYGVNVRFTMDDNNQWKRLVTYPATMQKEAITIFDTLIKGYQGDIEVEEIYILDNGDYEYKVIKTTEVSK